VRHSHAHARVVEDVVELPDEGYRVLPGGVADEEQRDREADRDPYDVLFQGYDFRSSGKIPS
jgi:hypothetical protein